MMKKMKNWVLAAILLCGASVFPSCTDTIGTVDNPVKPVNPTEELASETFIHEERMDRTTKPGDSFWQFALGSWLKNHDVDDQGLFMNSSNRQTKELKEKLATNPTQNHTIQLLMGPKPSKEEQLAALQNVVAQLKDGDDLTKADVMRNIGKVADMGYCALLGHDLYGVDGLIKYNITPGRLMNPMIGFFGKTAMVGVVKALLQDNLGMDIDQIPEKLIDDVIDIELWINDFQSQWRGTDPSPAIIGHGRDVMKSTPVPALQILSGAKTRATQGDDELKTTFREAFHIDSETYCQPEVEQIFELIEKYDVASLQLYLKTYLASKLAGAVLDDSSTPLSVYGVLSEDCPSLFLDYQKAVLTEGSDFEGALEMLEEMRGLFAEHILAADWLSDATKTKALEKLQAMKFHVGAPETLFNANFKLTGKTPVEDLVQHRQQTDDYLRNQLAGKPANGECAWDLLFITPSGFGLNALNAAYEPSTNQLFVLPVFLRGEMFPSDKQSVKRYVTLMAFAHEMTHGFDGKGATFDAIGNRKNWWTAEDKAKFEQRQQIIVERYNELEQVPGVPANGEFTKDENMADQGGFDLAWEMWNRKLKADGLTGEALRHQQRQFFISYADFWQSDDDESSLMKSLNTNVHSPNHNRVNGIVRLIDDWYTLFGVEPGDKLYVKPEDRVKIW